MMRATGARDRRVFGYDGAMPDVYTLDNVETAGFAEILRKFVDHLLANDWSVVLSGDGTTVGAAGEFVWVDFAAVDNIRAWVVLAAPSGGRQMSIQRGNSDTQWRIAHNAPGANYAGNEAGNRLPDCASERVHIGGGTPASPSFGTPFVGSPTSLTWHSMVRTGNIGEFWLVVFANGSGVSLMLALDPVALPDTGDTDPVVWWFGVRTANDVATALILDSTAQLTSFTPPMCGEIPGLGHYSFRALAHREVAGQIPANWSDGKAPFAPLLYGRRSPEPPNAYKGTSSLFYTSMVALAPRETVDVTGPRSHLCLGSIIVDWGGNNQPAP